ncbi:hypothetical protein YA0783_23135 [Pseudomonas corrugata]|uniref:hypothetical protein n=1 Tax=Pseudomonas corrugata TaxID=47879 RepID=UPI0018E5C22A|nr:hypothetical protein [Pseudomonas corrugata]MBI6621196.1 hypothetical protein [Pseudomonas corrugata]MBI6693762.1 hypothetical protein [Pseudomonas corrugata]
MKVTNNSKALQGVHTALGVVYIQPGETKDVELTPEGHKGASRLSFLSVEGKAPASDGDERTELFAKLKELGIDAAGNSKTETLQKKLDEALAAKERADVIVQLTEKGVEFDEKDSLEDLKAKLAAA